MKILGKVALYSLIFGLFGFNLYATYYNYKWTERIAACLIKVDIYPNSPNKPLLIPSYCSQVVLKASPNGAVYVPIIKNSNEALTGGSWKPNTNSDKSYFNFMKIYKRGR